MADNKAKGKTPKEFFASFSENSESALYLVDYTAKFKKSVDLCYWRNLDLELLEKVIKNPIRKRIFTGILSSTPVKRIQKESK